MEVDDGQRYDSHRSFFVNTYTAANISVVIQGVNK